MPQNTTYGIKFPFMDSFDGKYFSLTTSSTEEIRTNLVHLLLTRKGSRYYLPNFGTRLLEYIFEPLDGPTFSDIESEIRDSVSEYIPNIQITKLTVSDASMGEENKGTFINDQNQRVYSVPNIGQLEHTAKVKIEYQITDDAFGASDFVIINI
jgi:phage baseplate assembly protein W